MTQGIFRSDEGRAAIRTWYGKFREKLPFPVEDATVSTRFGETHVLLAGPKDAPPVLVLHGALGGAPHTLREVAPLAGKFRLIAPDIVGQSVASAEVRPPIADDSYGRWATDVLDALGVAKAAVIGVSWGGLVALRTAQAAPERISALVLVVPAGIAQASAWTGLTRAALPMLLYRAFPTEKRLVAMVGHHFTQIDMEWARYLGDAMRFAKLDFRVPKNVQPDDFAKLDAPVLVFGADDDVHFPGAAIVERAPKLFRNLKRAELLEGCRHSPPFDDAFRVPFCGKIEAFLREAIPAQAA